jgi:H+-translocating NAD(P) transhydrogenase subunit alpha
MGNNSCHNFIGYFSNHITLRYKYLLMIVGSIKENLTLEKRVSITPETAKNIINLGLKVIIENNYATHIGITDKEYEKVGVEINNSKSEVLNNCNLLTKVNCPSDDEISDLKNNTILLGMLNPSKNQDKIKNIIKKNIKTFSLELLPRISRAQSMDVLSSQSNLAGYRSVVDSIYEFEKAIPMMMTAAGTVPAAKVLVIGAGVAGLQAIATAKRLGAIVSATDVRAASKEQVESLGGKFLTVEQSANLETEGGYAKEASEDFKKKQADMMKDALKKNDIVICTALIPGKPAPRILSEELVKLMRPGSIIYDLAVEQGGNSAFSEIGKINIINGIKVIGVNNLMNRLPLTASNLYAKNLFSFIRNLFSKEKKDFNIDLQDEIIEKTLIKEVT